jgi:hypothetical protein
MGRSSPAERVERADQHHVDIRVLDDVLYSLVDTIADHQEHFAPIALTIRAHEVKRESDVDGLLLHQLVRYLAKLDEPIDVPYTLGEPRATTLRAPSCATRPGRDSKRLNAEPGERAGAIRFAHACVLRAKRKRSRVCAPQQPRCNGAFPTA